MPTDILISSDPWENRVAILENGSLAEIYIEREEKVIGSIYKGKVQNVLPGMGASFVDIGIGRNAFLYVDDINKAPLNIGDVEITQGRSGWTINEKINRGDDLLVQIIKEPRGLKGARVSTNISLPGRYLILMPTGKFSGVSRKIESADERTRLKNVMKRIRPDEMATVVRTAAAGVSDAELIADLGVLIRMWHGILENYKSSNSASLVHKDMNLVFKAARDFITPEINRVLVDNQEECEKLRDFMRLLGPQYIDRISYYPQGKALFRDFKVNEEIAKLMRPKVILASGGSLVIETTEALTVIDVNSGKYAGGKTHEDTILHTNLEAAAEIARQVRLRDIGGIIVCDFIDMSSEANRTKVLNILETGLRRDRTRTTIQSFSALGLLEFTRKRVGKDLSAQLRASCPTCFGLGNVLSPETVTIETFRAVEHHHRQGPDAKPLSIVASPTVGAQIRYWHEDELADLAKKTDRKINLVIDAAGHPEHTRVTADPTPLAVKETGPVRVGDEFDIEIIAMRMPNPTSGVALVHGQLVEVENAAGAVGSTIGIRVIDVDDQSESILAEPRSPIANTEPQKFRRRKTGRALTPADQVEELRELAEEAARIAAMTPPPVRTVPLTPPTPVPLTKPSSAPVPAAVPLHRPQTSQRFVRRPNPLTSPTRPAVATEALPPADDFFDPTTFYEQHTQQAPPNRPQRFQPRAPRHGLHVVDPAKATPAPDSALDANDTDEELDAKELPGDAAAFGDNQRRRRRRRRRGRGRGPAVANTPSETTPVTPESPSMPNRTIFRVSATTAPEPTGQVAPPEPSRALTPWRPRVGQVAVEAPPPSIPPQDGPPIARPASRRGRPPKNAQPAAQLTTTPRTALPSQTPRRQQQTPLPLEEKPKPAPVSAPTRRVFTAAPPITPPPAPVAAAPPAELPRRRGRPPKNPASIAAAAARDAAILANTKAATRVTPAPAPAPVEAPAPKKRGRPPKQAVAPAPPPNPVGRPRATAAKAPTAAPASRGRKAAAPAKATPTRRKKS